MTYASLQMLQQAIEKVGKVDRAAVIKELQTGTFDTVIGKIKLENNLRQQFWWVGQWQDGEFYGVAPSSMDGAAPRSRRSRRGSRSMTESGQTEADMPEHASGDDESSRHTSPRDDCMSTSSSPG